jgi:hypothetical protein
MTTYKNIGSENRDETKEIRYRKKIHTGTQGTVSPFTCEAAKWAGTLLLPGIIFE